MILSKRDHFFNLNIHMPEGMDVEYLDADIRGILLI